MSKQDALLEIADIAKRNRLTLEDITEALNPGPALATKKSSGLLSRLFGYIGGMFIFAGICIYVGLVWDDLNPLGRILLTLGTGFSAFVMAIVATTDERFERAATPLFLISALLQPTGILVMMQEYSRGGDPVYGLLFMSFVMLTQQGLTFVAKQQTVLAFTALLFGTCFFSIAFDLMELDIKLIGLVIGASLLCIAWALDHSPHKAIAPVNYLVGSIIFLSAWFDTVRGTSFEILFLGTSIGLIFVSTLARSRSLLFIGTLAVISYIGYFTAKHFANDHNWPFILMLMGFILIGIGALAVKINNRYIKEAIPPVHS